VGSVEVEKAGWGFPMRFKSGLDKFIIGGRALSGNAGLGADLVNAGAQVVAVSYRLAPAM
jgi:hypothetical protein